MRCNRYSAFDMVQIVKLCGVALLCTVVVLILRQLRGDMAALVRIGGVVLIFGVAMLTLGDIIGELRSFAESNKIEGYLGIMLKALAFAFVTRLCSELCRDCGEGALASSVELCGKLSILALCIPLIGELMDYATGLLERA